MQDVSLLVSDDALMANFFQMKNHVLARVPWTVSLIVYHGYVVATRQCNHHIYFGHVILESDFEAEYTYFASIYLAHGYEMELKVFPVTYPYHIPLMGFGETMISR